MNTSNPVRGVRSLELRSTRPAWGVSSLATGRTGNDKIRGPLVNPAAANSSTMKGPRGLAGESCGRRCRTANELGRWVRGCFHVRSPEMFVREHGRNYGGSGGLRIRPLSLPLQRDSDVIREVKVMTNAGNSAAAGWLPVPGFSQPGDSNAVEWEWGLSRSRAFKRSSDAPCKAVRAR